MDNKFFSDFEAQNDQVRTGCGGDWESITTTPVLNWYVIYRHRYEERQSQAWRNLNSGRKDGRNVAKHAHSILTT